MLIAILLACAFVVALFEGKRLPALLSERPCQGHAWRRAFRQAEKQEIRDFLGLVMDAYGLPAREKLRLRPDDELLAIYRSIYAGRVALMDDCELEQLTLDLRRRYGLDLEACWNERLTLGEVFALAGGR